MKITGEIIVIEDDEDDQYMFQMAYEKLRYTNYITYFTDSTKVLEYLLREDVHPFMIISDISLPKLSGLDLQKMIFEDERLAEKAVPYIFLSTSTNDTYIKRAYAQACQGYFQKPADFNEFVKVIEHVIKYWSHSLTPNYPMAMESEPA